MARTWSGGPVLDARPSLDPRNDEHPIRPLLTSVAEARLRSYTWSLGDGDVLDQGTEGACVGFAWAHELRARPDMVPTDEAVARAIYRAAQRVDEWPGEGYDGTSVLAGVKAVQALLPGRVLSYRWATTLDDVLRTVAFRGPVVLGVPWHEGMREPDRNGLLHPTGDVLGWHAIVANGVSTREETLTLPNSWGPDWGRGGYARMRWDDVGVLMAEGGEVCVPLRRR